MLFLIVAVAFIGLITAATSLPAGQWKMVPTFVAAAVAVLGEWALFWRPLERDERRQERGARGLCPSCGYDLTGNTSGTCPECGTPFEIYARIGPSYVTREIRSVENPQQPSDMK